MTKNDPTTTGPADGKALLARIKPTRRETKTHICMSHELIEEFAAADAELTELRAAATTSKRNAGNGTSSAAVKKQAQKVRELEDAIVEQQIEFHFRALSKDAYRALCDDHPPRPDQRLDLIVGYHRDAVLDQMVRDCLVSPVFEDCEAKGCEHDDCGTWQQIVAVINPAEWEHLRATVNEANSGAVDAPKSLQASLILDRRATTSG